MNKNIFANFGKAIGEKSPEILAGIGIAGTVTATVFAVKATPKALRIIENEELDKQKKLTAKETVLATWKVYIPALMIETGAVACLIAASSVRLRRNTALAAAYRLSETALNECWGKMTETVGEKKVREIKEEICKSRADNDPPAENRVVVTKKGETLCYDAISGRYFKSDIETIKQAVNKLNYRLIQEQFITLNEFYEELDLPDIKIGYDLGWLVDKGLIDICFGANISETGEPCIAMNYEVVPEYGA